jgi:plastocyanin
VTAVDDHFHDAHPSGPIHIGNALVFHNEGSNLHNVTIEGTTYSHDLPVDGTLRIDPASDVFPGPGTYRLICKYHVDRGMKGRLVIVR